ncbi:MAG: FtsX-like permease family protein [Candidatus Eisenbacteria bacterium]|nr:FtsX-like permease family protein [Candidatus Eisenbacteria bacterium]
MHVGLLVHARGRWRRHPRRPQALRTRHPTARRARGRRGGRGPGRRPARNDRRQGGGDPVNAFRIALKTLRRKRIRTAFTVGGVGVAVAVLISLLAFDVGYQRALRRDIDRMGYQVLVTAKGCPYEAATLMLKGGGGLRYMEQDVYEKIVRDGRIDEIAPQLVSTVFSRDEGSGHSGISMYMGIADSHLELKPWMEFESGGWFSDDDVDEAILGYEAAELEQRKVGDRIFVGGVDKVLTVVGVFERTGTQDDGVIFLPLATAQRIFELPEKISGIGIRLKDLSDLPQFEEDLYDEPGIQVVSMAQVKGTILNLMSSARTLASSIAAVAIIVAVIGVMNTVLMSVFDRTKQIGVMKAMGASKWDVFRIVWVETTLVCLFGGVAGAVLAMAGGSAAEHIIRRALPYAPSGNLIAFSLPLVLSAIAGAILIGLVAGVYPASRAASMRPVEAIRSSD